MHGVKMINPSIYRELPGILPVYPVCAGLSQKLLRDTVKAVLEGCSEGIEESLPASMRQKYALSAFMMPFGAFISPAIWRK